MIDIDPIETQEWLEALQSVVAREGAARARFIMEAIIRQATKQNCLALPIHTDYINSIPPENDVLPTGDREIENRIEAYVRWNALIMVIRAQAFDSSLGGHIGTFASIASLYEVGFNYFFKGPDHPLGADLIYFQGHSSPGLYARSYLSGVLSEDKLNHFRQEIGGEGLSSYPHPWLMPDYWQFATVSMGLGPLQAIYQARFLKYLQARGLTNQDPNVWCFCGDGEMDEVDSTGALSMATQAQCDNLIFVINCNMQRLDGPVRGNGKIIQELEGIFRGAGWRVIKLIWGRAWDPLLANDKSGELVARMTAALDGDYLSYSVHGGAYMREHFFSTPSLKALVSHLSDSDLMDLARGGHDPQKIFSAYHEASKKTGKPTVILVKSLKGYGLGTAGEGLNIAHNIKKLTLEQLQTFRDRFAIPIADLDLAALPFYHPSTSSPEYVYLKQRRDALGGFLPARRQKSSETLSVPGLADFDSFLTGTADRSISTTMVFVRLLGVLLKDKNIGTRIVPIVPDEARTFGMEGLFRQLGIYAPQGQQYEPVDKSQLMFYKESPTGQLLQEGISEAGAFCSWLAAATAYSTVDRIMIPFYIFYSMFGFQRIADLAWAAGDMRARGFLLGATGGRTTLNGEGLQHQDGHSLVMSALVPNCISYDPAFSYELTVIIQHGLTEMIEKDRSVFYYIMLMNENYVHYDMPKGVEAGIIKGLYLLKPQTDAIIQLFGSGAILNEVIAAQDLLAKDFAVQSNVWSVTSYTELSRESLAIERWNRLHPDEPPKINYVTACLADYTGPILSATDYVKLYAEQLRQAVGGRRYVCLGTDGFGRSDTRAKLRSHFEVDRMMIAYTAVIELVNEGKLDPSAIEKAREIYQIANKKDPMYA